MSVSSNRGRINYRIPLFAAAVLLMLGWPVYSYVNEAWTGGIHDRGSYKEVDLKAMGFFRLDPDSPSIRDVPAKYRQLDGQKVLLNGLIVPHQQAGPYITDFTIIFSPLSCCGFGGPPLVQERVFATTAPSVRLLYDGPSDSRYDVTGTLHVTMKRNDVTGAVIEVYHLDAESMTPAK